MIKLGTVFSGIGGIEQALIRLGIPHDIVFACDNGDVEINLLENEELAEYIKLKKLRSKKQLKNKDDISRLAELSEKENRKAEEIRQQVYNCCDKIEKKKLIDTLYATKSRQINFVKKTYLANYDLPHDDYHLDIRFLDGRDYEGIDLLVGGSPCQSFSTVGAQRGLEDTRGTLFYDYVRIIQQTRPKVFIYENVRGLTTHDDGQTLSIILNSFRNGLGYDVPDPCILNASDYSIPQTRRRIFVVGFRKDIPHKPFSYPEPVALKYTMQDFLEDNCAAGHFNYDPETGGLVVEKVSGKADDKFTLTPAVQRYVLSAGTGSYRTSTQTDLPVARTLMKMMTQHHRAGVDNYITVSHDPLTLRQLSDREALRLMGYPDSFKIAVSSTQTLRQAGNSMVVDVMMAIMKSIIKTGVFDE